MNFDFDDYEDTSAPVYTGIPADPHDLEAIANLLLVAAIFLSDEDLFTEDLFTRE